MGDRQQGQILALLAHPDDETFIFGGTIAHYAKRGVSVKVVSATKGDMGRRMGNPPFITRETMPIVREQELREACRCLGAEEPIFLGIRDKTVEYEDYESLVRRLCAIIRANKPDVVLTFHPVLGGHPDHCAIGRAAVAATAAASDPDYVMEGFDSCSAPSLYYISFGEQMKQPERYGLRRTDIVRIDVSDSTREKLNAFRAHRTQTEMDEWLWQRDEAALKHFGRYEYFVIADHLPRERSDDLFIQRPR
jgi:N-acetylglucosamine malate deacetylase 2